MRIDTVSRLRLDIHGEILRVDLGETLRHRRGNGGNVGVSGGEAVATAVGEVVCCVFIIALKRKQREGSRRWGGGGRKGESSGRKRTASDDEDGTSEIVRRGDGAQGE